MIIKKDQIFQKSNIPQKRSQQKPLLSLCMPSLLQSLPLTKCVLFQFDRHKSCIFSDPIYFQLSQFNKLLFSKKTTRFFHSQFKIYVRNIQNRNKLYQQGILRSNFDGSMYNLYIVINNIEIVMCTIHFHKNHQLNLREVDVYINLQNDKEILSRMSFYKFQNLIKAYDKKQQNLFNIFKAKSKLPIYNAKSKSYQLSFGVNDNIISSVKNTILIDEKGKQFFKFYKNSAQTYNVLFINPFSWLVVYSYALATLDFKLTTQ